MIDASRLHTALCLSTYRIYNGLLRGDLLDGERARFERVTHARPGDLVMEITTIWMRDRDAERLGVLKAIEWVPCREPEDDEDPAKIPRFAQYVLQLPDGRDFRWDNASFIRVLEDIESFGEEVRAWDREQRTEPRAKLR